MTNEEFVDQYRERITHLMEECKKRDIGFLCTFQIPVPQGEGSTVISTCTANSDRHPMVYEAAQVIEGEERHQKFLNSLPGGRN